MIINKTRKKILSKDFKICKNLFQKSIGLMFTTKPKTLIFEFKKEKKISLHMFFVFYPIDVLFLNKNKRVVEIKENFKPFTIYFPERHALYIIELPNKTIKRSKTKLNDKISF